MFNWFTLNIMNTSYKIFGSVFLTFAMSSAAISDEERPERPSTERPERSERPTTGRPARGGRGNERTAPARGTSRDRVAVDGNAPLVMNQIMGLLKDRANSRGIDRRTLLEAIDKLDRNGDNVFTADELLGARGQRP